MTTCRTPPTNALAFLAREDITYPSVNDPARPSCSDSPMAVPISATPTTLVIDKTGHIAGHDRRGGHLRGA